MPAEDTDPRPNSLPTSYVDPPLPSAEALSRRQARVLDPVDALLLTGQQIRSTAYIADQLLLLSKSEKDRDEGWGAIAKAADELHLQVDRPGRPPKQRPGVDGQQPAAELITFTPGDGFAVRPDAWTLLQTARARTRRALDGIGLNHLLFVTPGGVIGQHEPNGGAGTNGFSANSAAPEYGQAGRGGRSPVAYVGPRPARQEQLPVRRPVVAILDMGCGVHDWLPNDGTIVDRAPTLDGAAIGEPGTGEEELYTDGPMDGTLHWAFGHGTFHCGLVRQKCADADLISARVVPPDGLLDEFGLAKALHQIYELARRHVDGEPGGRPVDVVSLALGYYHEQLSHPTAGLLISAAIEDLGRIGVAVVASAGNDATQRPLWPAALSLSPPEAGRLPLTSVAALNPDGSIALFSNGGDWVKHWEPGAAVISTMPSYDGGANAAAQTIDPSAQLRRAFDPDHYSGFACWSGTSFAAPVLAGRLAQSLLCASTSGGTSLNKPGREAAIDRGMAALAACVPPVADLS